MNNKREQRFIELYDNVSQKAQKPQKFPIQREPPCLHEWPSVRKVKHG